MACLLRFLSARLEQNVWPADSIPESTSGEVSSSRSGHGRIAIGGWRHPEHLYMGIYSSQPRETSWAQSAPSSWQLSSHPFGWPHSRILFRADTVRPHFWHLHLFLQECVFSGEQPLYRLTKLPADLQRNFRPNFRIAWSTIRCYHSSPVGSYVHAGTFQSTTAFCQRQLVSLACQLISNPRKVLPSRSPYAIQN